jgi:hypothetical protein
MFLKEAFAIEIKALEKKKAAAALKRVAGGTPVATGAARDSWRLEGTTVVSDSPYMAHLNYGSSEQAPAHFIERAVLADPSLVPKGTIVLMK